MWCGVVAHLFVDAGRHSEKLGDGPDIEKLSGGHSDFTFGGRHFERTSRACLCLIIIYLAVDRGGAVSTGWRRRPNELRRWVGVYSKSCWSKWGGTIKSTYVLLMNGIRFMTPVREDYLDALLVLVRDDGSPSP